MAAAFFAFGPCAIADGESSSTGLRPVTLPLTAGCVFILQFPCGAAGVNHYLAPNRLALTTFRRASGHSPTPATANKPGVGTSLDAIAVSGHRCDGNCYCAIGAYRL